MILLIMILLHRNTRSLLANGQDFKHFIANRRDKPDVICVQETWLRPNLEFALLDYVVVRQDRIQGSGGGCATFIRRGVPYRVVGLGKEQEYVVVEVWADGRKIVLINYYNPCRQMRLEELERVEGQDGDSIIWCGDFNAHSTLWGGRIEQTVMER